MRKQSKSSTTQPRADVYERITNRIIEQLEQGTRPWMQPWGACGTPVRPLRHNGVPYRGINTVLLWMEASERGYSSPFWMTYKQAQELGGQVRKGENRPLSSMRTPSSARRRQKAARKSKSAFLS